MHCIDFAAKVEENCLLGVCVYQVNAKYYIQSFTIQYQHAFYDIKYQ